ncbi:MAG: FAD-dependent oxidoreductase, partial [Promethearchaeota archaeon]
RRTWRGLYPMTPDGNPILGIVEGINGYINAVGMSGQGFMLGPGIGELMSRLIQTNLTTQDKEILNDFSFTRDYDKEEDLK